MSAPLRLDVVTIFPDYLAPLRQGLLGRAIERGQVHLGVHDLRHWTDDVHRTVDDTPYGGGPGMVMIPEPWGRALDEIAPADGPSQPRLIVPSPAGAPLTQATAARLAREPWLLFACGRYEGIDQRVLDDAARRMPVEELSLGDYVLHGGEVAVLVIVEALSRLLPGVLGNACSAYDDSFAAGTAGLLEAPSYTKPAVWRGLAVPPVLMSGHHAQIERWRAEQSVARTTARRPDLISATDARAVAEDSADDAAYGIIGGLPGAVPSIEPDQPDTHSTMPAATGAESAAPTDRDPEVPNESELLR